MPAPKTTESDDQRKLRVYQDKINELERENAALRGSPTVQPGMTLYDYRKEVPQAVLFTAGYLAQMTSILTPQVRLDGDGDMHVVENTCTESMAAALDAGADLLYEYFQNLAKIERSLIQVKEPAKKLSATFGPTNFGGV